jgi:hypothetical protein
MTLDVFISLQQSVSRYNYRPRKGRLRLHDYHNIGFANVRLTGFRTIQPLGRRYGEAFVAPLSYAPPRRQAQPAHWRRKP